MAPNKDHQQVDQESFLDAGGHYEPQHTYDNTPYDTSGSTCYTSAHDSSQVLVSDPQAEPTQSQGDHPMLGIFNDYMNSVKAHKPAPEAAGKESTQAQGGHSVLGIFNDYMKDIKALNSAPVAAAAQSASAPSVQGTMDVMKMSQQMWARHQMNMGMVNSNAAMFGMHNAAMAGIGTYGSSYNNYYDTTYQSYKSNLNPAQNDMYTGMALASMYK